MKPLTVSEEDYARRIMEGTADLRKVVTLHRKKDPKYAQFRVQTMNIIQDFVLRKVTGRKQTKKTMEYLDGWKNDLGIGKDIIALFDAIDNF